MIRTKLNKLQVGRWNDVSQGRWTGDGARLSWNRKLASDLLAVKLTEDIESNTLLRLHRYSFLFSGVNCVGRATGQRNYFSLRAWAFLRI